MATITEARRHSATTAPVDVITIDIIENAMRNARREMDAVLFRTAVSPGIREQGDAFPLIADREGRMVVGQFGSFIQGFLDGFDGEVREGDVFFTSSPYHTAGAISHANDWLILIPIYFEKGLIGWAAMFGHMTDVGGKVPGSLPTDATSIHEEGVIVPPIRLFEDGAIRQDLLDVILSQVRLPEWNRADLNAVIASCRTAERRVQDLCGRFGVETYLGVLEALLERNRAAMLRLFKEMIPTDRTTFSDYVDDDGLGFGPYKIECAMWREGERVVLDFTGTSVQSPGPINLLLNENMLKMFFGVYMIMVFDPQILWNDGFYPLVDVRVPPGTLLSPETPAPLSCRTHALGRIFDVLGGLLGKLTPEFRTAAGFSSSPHFMYSGVDRHGDWFQLYQIGFGGVPGRPQGDGHDGHSMWPNFTNVPNEYLERYFPLVVERYETIPDSGGAGLHRGGNAMVVSYRFLEPGSVSIHDDRWFTHPWGVNGGAPGSRGWKLLHRANGGEEFLPSKCDRVFVDQDDVLDYVTWGGGGWGDPLLRDLEQIDRDLRRGLVTVSGVARSGVVVDAVGAIDLDATARRRSEMRAQRGQVSDYDFGPSIDELRDRCLEETGLPAPADPQTAEHAHGLSRKPATIVDHPGERPTHAQPEPAPDLPDTRAVSDDDRPTGVPSTSLLAELVRAILDEEVGAGREP